MNLTQLYNSVYTGDVDPLQAYAELKKHIADANECLKSFEDYALEEATKYDKSFTAYGFKFERRNGSKRYSFNHIPQWKAISNELKSFEDKCKQALNTYEKGMQVADENGEEIPLPKVTYTKDVLIIKQ